MKDQYDASSLTRELAYSLLRLKQEFTIIANNDILKEKTVERFKVGDRVQYKGRSGNVSFTVGTVTQAPPWSIPSAGFYNVQWDGHTNPSVTQYKSTDLVLASTFKVGDRVERISGYDSPATITRVVRNSDHSDGYSYSLKYDDLDIEYHHFRTEELVKSEKPSPEKEQTKDAPTSLATGELTDAADALIASIDERVKTIDAEREKLLALKSSLQDYTN